MNNTALTWLDRVQDDCGKLTRWALLLKRFCFDVEHVPGRSNELADALFRRLSDEEFAEDLTYPELEDQRRPFLTTKLQRKQRLRRREGTYEMHEARRPPRLFVLREQRRDVLLSRG